MESKDTAHKFTILIDILLHDDNKENVINEIVNSYQVINPNMTNEQEKNYKRELYNRNKETLLKTLISYRSSLVGNGLLLTYLNQWEKELKR